MGYFTTFDGKIFFNRPLTNEELKEFDNESIFTINNDFMEVLDETKCDFEFELKELIEKFFTPKGISLNGKVKWKGEEFEDIGYYEIENNIINTYVGKISITYLLK